MKQLEIDLDVTIKEDLRQYIMKNMPTFLSDIPDWICQDIRRNMDDPETLFDIGNQYFFGSSLLGNSRSSRFQVRGQIRGLRLLGRLSYGIGFIVEKDYLRALIFYLAASDRGHIGAFFMLGIAYFQGLAVEPNIAEALLWFRRSHSQKELFPNYMLNQLEQWGPILFLTEKLKASQKKVWVAQIEAFLGLPDPLTKGNRP